MGIDPTDFVFRLERRLGIKLRPQSLAWGGTVADLAASVAAQLGPRVSAKPPSVEFEEFRGLVSRCAELRPEQIAEESRWTEMLGPGLPRVWRRLRRERPELPRLELTKGAARWRAALNMALLVLSAGLAVAFLLLGQSLPVAAACLAPGFGGVVIIGVLFGKLNDQLPAGIVTVGDVLPLLVPAFEPKEPGERTPGEQLIQDEAVVRLVRAMLVETIGVEYGKTRLDARLREDLDFH